MAELFVKRAEDYAEARPSYPPESFEFIASKTPTLDLAWDASTGSGQAARSLAGFYKNVVATDTSPAQLSYAPKLSNVRYQHTPPAMSETELERYVAPQSSVDVVTVAAALHWFDLPRFYQQAKWVLKKPHGVVAAWTYSTVQVNDAVDAVSRTFYSAVAGPYWKPTVKLVENGYRTIDFPFERVNGVDHTGPFQFVCEKLMDLDHFFALMRSCSSYQIAKEKGVELLSDDVIEEFKGDWTADGEEHKVLKFSILLRMGRVGNT